MTSWKQLFQKGVAMFQADQLDDALALFDEALTLESNEYTLYDSRAAVNEKLGKTKDALRDCKRVIDIAPHRWQGYARSARLFLKIKKCNNALHMIKLALDRVAENEYKRRADLEALQSQISQCIDEQRQTASNVSYHFGKLPLEIASDIFASVLSEDHARVVVLAQVCKNWRLTIVNTPTLWSNLVLSNQSPVKKAKVWRARSKGRLVHLTLWDSLKPEPWALDEIHDLSFESLRTLRIADFPIHIVRERLPALTDSVLRNLDVLEVDNRTEARPVTWLWADPGMKLRSLYVHFTVFDWTALATNFPQLEHFSFKGPLVGVPLNAIGAFLRAHNNLRSLFLGIVDSVYHRAPERDQPSIELPLLERLEIEYHDSAMSFMFPLLYVPELRTLSVYRGGHAIDSSLRHLIMRGGAKNLRELKIHVCAVSASCVIDVLREAETLEVLELTYLGGSQANTVLQALSETTFAIHAGHLQESGEQKPDIPTLLCSKLRHINFSHCPDIKSGPLMDLVNAHLPSSASHSDRDDAAQANKASGPTPIDTLILDGCQSVEMDILPWLRCKVKHVSCVYMSKKDAKWRR